MKVRFIICCFAIICISQSFFAQSLTQTLRGKVTDADSGQPLAGATVQIIENQFGTVTDSAGNYCLSNVPVGRYQVQVSFVGYQSLTVTEILLESGRELVQNIALSESSAALSEVVVQASRRVSHPVSVQSLTIEEVLRFPATFYDPARLAMAYAGVASDNDQANGISIRGNSPNGLIWRLEGVDIVNPNHTPNAGTTSDRVTASGGGVNILSAQMLDNSTFYTGAFPAAYGNALGGILDMHLRPGNDQQHETIVQIGLIGMDVAQEGPLSKSSDASYLFNARYSTVGLLGQLGINFGDEQIRFYDLSVHFNVPYQNGAKLTLFGIGGSSQNLFEAQRDSTQWLFQKDRFDITFRSAMGAGGCTFTQPVGKRGIWRTAVAYSALDSQRYGDRLDDSYETERVESDQMTQQKLSWHTYWQFKPHSNLQWQYGALSTTQIFNINSTDNQQLIASGRGGGVLIQPYMQARWQVSAPLLLHMGLTGSYFTFNQAMAIEPRMALQWRLRNTRSLNVAYGLHSQLQQPQLYFAEVNGENPNKHIGFTRAHHVVLGYREQWRKVTLRTEVFWQHVYDAPVSADAPTAFSALNLLEEFITERLVNAGVGRNYGIELTLQRYMLHDLYFLTNASWYNASYQGSDGVWRNTRWNGGYIFNGIAGKEWRRARRAGSLDAVFGFHVRGTLFGGFRNSPIDAVASDQMGRTIFIENEAFSMQQQPYFRTDIRLYFKRHKIARNSTFSLDIQNATNAKNIAYSYYDTQQKQIVNKNQLGLIPLLNWRLEL